MILRILTKKAFILMVFSHISLKPFILKNFLFQGEYTFKKQNLIV